MRPIIYILSLLACLSLATSCKYSRPHKQYSQAQAQFAPFDGVIIPGVPFRDSSWNRVMKLRVYWAKYLWDQGMTKNIIFSGGAVYTEYSEAKIMKLYAMEMGIPEEHIFLDTLAQHSTENVYYSYWVAQDNELENIALASDPYQTKGLKRFVYKLNRKYTANVQLLPAMTDSIISQPLPDYDIEFEKAKEDSNFVNITETQGIFYRLGGTMGLHVDWENRP
jgi:vancomycin permeability regulator SanA